MWGSRNDRFKEKKGKLIVVVEEECGMLRLRFGLSLKASFELSFKLSFESCSGLSFKLGFGF